jgi:hypothetical protein
MPVYTKGDNTYKLQVYQVHHIVNPTSDGAGIVADVNFKNTAEPYYEQQPRYTAYFYMSADGTIKESSIVKLVDPVKYDFASTKTAVYDNKVVIFAYGLEGQKNESQSLPVIPGSNDSNQDDGKTELIIFDALTSKITYTTQLGSTYPYLKDISFSGIGNVDEYSVTAIFRDDKNYGYGTAVYYMMNPD